MKYAQYDSFLYTLYLLLIEIHCLSAVSFPTCCAKTHPIQISPTTKMCIHIYRYIREEKRFSFYIRVNDVLISIVSEVVLSS